jgi:hypothetical protein
MMNDTQPQPLRKVIERLPQGFEGKASASIVYSKSTDQKRCHSWDRTTSVVSWQPRRGWTDVRSRKGELRLSEAGSAARRDVHCGFCGGRTGEWGSAGTSGRASGREWVARTDL